MTLKHITILATALAITSCSPKESAQTPAEALIDHLVSLVDEGKIMYGHQDDLLYGHSWKLSPDQQSMYSQMSMPHADAILLYMERISVE